MIKIINGDLLLSSDKFICHQTNCVSKNFSGIAKSIFNKYPIANTYINRTMPSVPGTIDIFEINNKFILNLNAQYYPGKFNNNYENDSESSRQQYFSICLDHISNLENIKTIGFPYLIGCGLAKGNWEIYEDMLINFGAKIYKSQGALTTLYKI